jgi:hypothetical protein
MEIINPENGGFLYYVLIVNRAFSGLCWGDHREAFPRSLKNRDWNPKKMHHSRVPAPFWRVNILKMAALSCSGVVLASEIAKNFVFYGVLLTFSCEIMLKPCVLICFC